MVIVVIYLRDGLIGLSAWKANETARMPRFYLDMGLAREFALKGQMGDDVIVPPTLSTSDAKNKFQDVREIRPYLRFTSGEIKA